jgi:arginine-tRNA-protein transferase
MPTRNQRRAWNRNSDLIVNRLPPDFNHEHFQLYKKYLSSRHPDGGMDNPTQDAYLEFLAAPWSDTVFFEMRSAGDLVAVAVTDIMENGLSAVYTFFDPQFAGRSPGKFAILYQIEQSRILGLEWLYLGYWIKNCGKMKYKSEYRPQQVFQNNAWQDSYNPEVHECTLPVL